MGEDRLGFQLILYHEGVMLTVRSEMDGLGQLDRMGRPKNSPR